MINVATALDRTSFLRRVLLLDAVVSGTIGLVMLVGASLLESRLTLPAPLLQYVGISLLPYAAFVAWVAMRQTLSRPIVWMVVGCNVLYAIDCVLLIATGWVEPTVLGQLFVLAQALGVGLFAELQILGLRRAAASPVV